MFVFPRAGTIHQPCDPICIMIHIGSRTRYLDTCMCCYLWYEGHLVIDRTGSNTWHTDLLQQCQIFSSIAPYLCFDYLIPLLISNWCNIYYRKHLNNKQNFYIVCHCDLYLHRKVKICDASVYRPAISISIYYKLILSTMYLIESNKYSLGMNF